MVNAYVIGCGGLGGYLTAKLLETVAGSSLEFLESCRIDTKKFNTDAGKLTIPSIVDSITLVEKDVFDPHNVMRQGYGSGSKLEHTMAMMSGQLGTLAGSQRYNVCLRTVRLRGVSAWLHPGNIERIIPLEQPSNPDNIRAFEETVGRARLDFSNLKMERLYKRQIPVVFICVDNVQTRYEVSKYMERFEDCLVINGGNEYTKGHVTIYERCNGKALDPNLYEIYQNIRPGVDKRPDQIACGEVSEHMAQTAEANELAALIMRGFLRKWLAGKLDEEKPHNKVVRNNEVLFDINGPMLMALDHKLPKAKA